MHKLRALLKRFKTESPYLLIIILASLLLVGELFLIPGRGITFDGHIHMTTMAQFAAVLKQGEFPVRWTNNFANYGLPLPLFAHQLPIYFGAVLELLVNNPVMAYNLTMLTGVSLSAIIAYCFFREYSQRFTALIGSLLFNFAAYRIINIYIRGALPEVFASAFLPLALLGIVRWFKKRHPDGVWLTLLGFIGLALSHPMVLITSLFVIVPFVFFYNWPVRQHWLFLLRFLLVGGLAFLVSSYYLLPLVLESKYFYFGLEDSSLASNAFLSVKALFSPKWYFYLGHPGPRGDFVKLGLIEMVVFVFSLGAALLDWLKNKKIKLLQLSVIITGILLALTLPFSRPIYEKLFFLNKIQFPFRMLGSVILVIGLMLVLLLKQLRHQSIKLFNFVCLIGLALTLFLRVPQLYSKNSTVYDQKQFYFTHTNLHTQNLNPIWSGNSEDYPLKTKQFEVIAGSGSVQPLVQKNSKRIYLLESETPMRLVDFTFYFPGWRVVVDGQETQIEFQDPNYRGLITYQVPAGKHTVVVKYGLTKVRLLSYAATAGGVILVLMLGIGLPWFPQIRQLIFPRSYKNRSSST